MKNESLYEVKSLNKTINRNNFCGVGKKWWILICDLKKKYGSYMYVYSVIWSNVQKITEEKWLNEIKVESLTIIWSLYQHWHCCAFNTKVVVLHQGRITATEKEVSQQTSSIVLVHFPRLKEINTKNDLKNLLWSTSEARRTLSTLSTTIS